MYFKYNLPDLYKAESMIYTFCSYECSGTNHRFEKRGGGGGRKGALTISFLLTGAHSELVS